MSLLDDTTHEIIAEFGEPVEIVPHLGYQHDSDDFYQSDAGWDEANSFTVKARSFRQTIDEKLSKEGFDEEGDAMFYFGDDYVDEGDLIRDQEGEWIVMKIYTKQLGHGTYHWTAVTQSHDQ